MKSTESSSSIKSGRIEFISPILSPCIIIIMSIFLLSLDLVDFLSSSSNSSGSIIFIWFAWFGFWTEFCCIISISIVESIAKTAEIKNPKNFIFSIFKVFFCFELRSEFKTDNFSDFRTAYIRKLSDFRSRLESEVLFEQLVDRVWPNFSVTLSLLISSWEIFLPIIR